MSSIQYPRDTFRRRGAGNVSIPVNSKPMDDSFHVDRSRLGTHEEYDPDAPNEWGGKGKYVETPNDIRRNAVAHAGDLRALSSNKNPDSGQKDTGTGPCCVPSGYPPYGRNPIYRKRGE